MRKLGNLQRAIASGFDLEGLREPFEEARAERAAAEREVERLRGSAHPGGLTRVSVEAEFDQMKALIQFTEEHEPGLLRELYEQVGLSVSYDHANHAADAVAAIAQPSGAQGGRVVSFGVRGGT